MTSPTRSRWSFTTPVGELTLVATDTALSGVYMHEYTHRPPPSTFGPRDPGAFTAAVDQLEQYFAGERTDFDLELDDGTGTAFQREVWTALRGIPYGATRSYAQLAAAVGRPTAFRAVGAANGRNPLSIIVPCHRVIGAAGALTGYGGGTANKRILLELEGALPGVDQPGAERTGARSAG